MCAAVEQMRKQFPQEQLNFHLDFPDDYAERKATDLLAIRNMNGNSCTMSNFAQISGWLSGILHVSRECRLSESI